LLQLARQLTAGVLTTLNGRGVIPEDDPLCLGNMSNDPDIQDLVAAADVMLAVWTRFQGPSTQNWRMKLPPVNAHLDVDADEFNRNYPAAVAVHGGAEECLRDIIAALGERGASEPGWSERVAAARSCSRSNLRARLGPQAEIMDTLRAALPRDTIVVK